MKGEEIESSNNKRYIENTSDNGEILYSKATTIVESRKRLSDVWFIDLGTIWHMTSRREWFHKYEAISEGSAYMDNDNAMKIAGIGTTKIKIFDVMVRTIEDVRHVKRLKKNLLSLG